jgi:fimbrial chaperone protein
VTLTFSDTNFSVSGKSVVRTAYVINGSKELVPIKLSVTNWRIDEEGNNINEETEDFLIEPTQLLLRPKEKKVITVRYVGPVDLDREETFQILAAEVPVRAPLTRGNFELQILQNMIQTVYVNKPDFKHDISLEKVELIHKDVPFDDEEGVRQLESRQFFKLTFKNAGRKRYVNKGLKVTLYPKSRKKDKDNDRELELEVQNMPLILGDSTRIKYIEWPEKMKSKKWKGQIKEQR